MDEEKLLKYLSTKTGCSNIYIQPPGSTEMKYPCLKVELSNISNLYANDKVYLSQPEYEVILITRNVNDPIIVALSSIPYTTFNTRYVADNLYHFVFTIYINTFKEEL